MKVSKDCINCKIAILDPECGYTCDGEHWNTFGNADSCPYYEIDTDYLLGHAKTLLEKMQVKRFIRKNSKK